MSGGEGFDGPVFVVGMPRSGTSLVRALLNGHREIGLTLAESHFIPHFVRRYGERPSFAGPDDLRRFAGELLRTPFMATAERRSRGLDVEAFVERAKPGSWASIFEHVFRSCGAKPHRTDVVWGDKTPGYVRHMPLLGRIFPAARFLHVLRDPRDQCLSVRSSWGKSLYRAAERWRRGVETAERDGRELGRSYLELRYESVLASPEEAMRRVCAFLDLDYDEAMIRDVRSGERWGGARGSTGIVTGNAGKYRRALDGAEIRRIEEIVGPVAARLGYEPETGAGHRPLGPLQGALAKLRDGLASVRHHIRHEGGVIRGLRRLRRSRTYTSWR